MYLAISRGGFKTCEHPVYVYSLPTSDDNNQAQQVKHCILLIDTSRVFPSLHKITS